MREVNGHVHCTFSHSSPTPGWTKPQFVESPYLNIHGMAPGLNYGVQCYEGMKAFRRPDGQISIFRPDQNARRMQRGADFICIPPVPEPLFLECVHLAVAMNAEFVPPHETGAAMYIRPLLFASSAQLGLNPTDEYTFVVFVMPTGVYHGAHAVDALILEDFDRTAPEGTGSVKVGGNYAPVLRHSERARQKGFGITLHLDSKTRTEIDEFSTSGFIGIIAPASNASSSAADTPAAQPTTTVVIPASKNVIQSVTSDSTAQIAQDLFGWRVERRRVAYEELPTFSEVMAAGTAASLVPIRSITMVSRGDKFEYPVPEDLGPGPCTAKLLATLKGIQQGKIKDPFGWCSIVRPPPDEYARGRHGVVVDGQMNGVDRLP